MRRPVEQDAVERGQDVARVEPQLREFRRYSPQSLPCTTETVAVKAPREKNFLTSHCLGAEPGHRLYCCSLKSAQVVGDTIPA